VLLEAPRHAVSSSLALGAEILSSTGIRASLESPDGELKVGGEPVIQLSRKPKSHGTRPEFLSATILPGRGMNLLQITANLPGKGEVEIFATPPIEEAAKTLNSEPENSQGVLSFTFGGAFLLPYANRIRGTLTPDGKNIRTEWNGKTLTLPAVWKGKTNPSAELHAIHGLILNRKADAVTVKTTSDGQILTGIIHAGDFDGHWPSKTDARITISLAGDAIEVAITVKNVGAEDEPMGIGWHPYFAFPSGDRKQVSLSIPASQLAEVNNYDDVFPTGKLVPVEGTKYDFTSPQGKQLDDIFLDDNFSSLTRKDGNVIVDVIDPAASYGLHIKGLSDKIRTIQVYAPPEKPFAAIEEQFNFADPFSGVWKGMDTGMVTLKPGHEVTWKVRLELFTPGKELAGTRK
jgi:galactose mutarotase-like enzyme